MTFNIITIVRAIGICFLLNRQTPKATAFVPSRQVQSSLCHSSVPSQSSTSLKSGGDFFDSFKRFLGGEGEGEGDDENNSESITEDEEAAAGTSLIASIPVRSIKLGGLRLFLMFYLLGMQNTPDRKSWRANQPSSEDYVLEMFFHDATGVIVIELLDTEIRISRCGSVPSTAYHMQESVVVQGVLDELHQCAFDGEVNAEDRLMVPEPQDAIDLARGSLPFG